MNKELVYRMVKLQILCARWLERNTTLRFPTVADVDNILLAGRKYATYNDAIKHLKTKIDKYCKNEYLSKEIDKLDKEIESSAIKDFRFGLEPKNKFSKIESDLDKHEMMSRLFMTTGMVGIKYIVENFELTESAVKQACQQERLLNTSKLGRNWMVHIPECVAYWGINYKMDGVFEDFKY
ncbi:hypothetical protein NL50_17470 [Clostridium acetobutylicum]|nr:hypothetical protein NL50_17470 [Clostridium acetobutylicum]